MAQFSASSFQNGTQKVTGQNHRLQTYILPATTQSRTLQYQQQQKLNLQLKSQGHLAQNTASSKSSSNLLQHSAGNLANAGGSTVAGGATTSSNAGAGAAQHMMTSPDQAVHNHHQALSHSKSGLHHSIRPESGKKRTSFLLNSQVNNQQPGNSSSNAGALSSQYNSGTVSAHMKHPNQLMNQYNSEVTQTQSKNTSLINPGGLVHESQTPSFVTSPPKRGGQTRKPSGKSTKSNRAALAKKQLITHNSSIFPSSTANGVTYNQHQLNHGASQHINSPVLAKINAAASSQPHGQSSNKHPVESSGGKLPNAHGGGNNSHSSSNTKLQSNQQSFSQPRMPSAKGGTAATGVEGGTQSSYIISKNLIEFRKGSSNQHRGGQAKESHTPSGVSNYMSEGPLMRHDKNKQPGMSNSNSMQAFENGVSQAKTNNLIEHGAVAAVIPSQNVSSQGTGKNNHSNRSQINSGSNQQFLPTIQNNNSSTTSNQSQAMHAATAISPYHSIEEVQQNIPNQPLSSSSTHLQHLSNQTPASDYFNLKQAHSAKYQTGVGGNSSSAAIRSTSQPHLQTINGQKTSQTLINTGDGKGQGLHQSQSFVVSSGQSSVAVPGQANQGASQGNAQQQMHDLLNKGLRSQSEPPQPQLKQSDSTASFMENLRQRATFSVVMKAAMLPKQPKRTGEKTGTEAQMASESVKATVTKLLQKNQPQSTLPFFQTSKVSGKAFGSVKAFAANTNVGIVRKANEDRISIILNVIQPAQKQPRIPPEQWPKLQIFGVYDGHGGSKCAEYLKDNLHNNIILQPEFPSDIKTAIRKGSYKTEEDFLKVAAPSPDQPHNKAGSCAIVILVVNDDIYILNVGDSRAIGSESQHPSDSMIHTKATQALNDNSVQSTPKVMMEAVSNVKQLSDDHKPSCPREFKRICDAGGYVYQTQTVMKNGLPTTQTQQVRQDVCPEPEDSDDEENPFVGPYRVFPGRLSVCRTFGDCEAKLAHLGGVQGVVTCEPETTHEVDGVNCLDYVLIGSDGIFDKLKNDTINQIVWDVTTKQRNLAHSQGQTPSIHTISGLVADEVLHASAKARSLDNLSVVFVAFKRFKEYIEMAHQDYEVSQPMQNPQPHQLTSLKQVMTSSAEKERSAKQTPSKGKRTVNSNDKSSTILPKTNLLSQIPSVDSKTLQKNSNSFYKLDSVNQVYSNSGFNTMKHQTMHHGTDDKSNKRGISANGPTDGTKTPNSTNQLYLNKIRDQQQNVAQRHAGMLENINRPSSRQGASRKGMRSRKANQGGGLAPNASSHSQDSRPTLPQVQQSMKGQGGASSGKNAYNHLSETKATNNSSSAATLPSTFSNSNNMQQNHTSMSTQHHQSQQQMVGGQGQVYASSREQMGSGNQNRRGGLFKVNTQQAQSSIVAGQGPASLQSTQGANASGSLSSMLPDFIVKTNGGTSGSKLITDNSGQPISTNQSNASRGAASSSNAATAARQKKMKPYKSSQTRRMPDNPSAINMDK